MAFPPLDIPFIPRPPAPRTTADRRKLDTAIAKAEGERAAAGGPAKLKTAELPHQVRTGETLTGVSLAYKSPLPGIEKSNPQIANPDLIFPDQVVFVPTRDKATIETRRQVVAAERADRSVRGLERSIRDPDAPPGVRKMLTMELSSARSNASEKWAVVRGGVETDLREAGRNAKFPVDEATERFVEQVRERAPESAGFQREVTAARKAIEGEWRKHRTTGTQIDKLTQDAQALDRSVAGVEREIRDPGTPGPIRKVLSIDLPSTRSAASEKWAELQTAAERELRYAGGEGPFPDKDAKPTLEALKARHPQNERYQTEVGEARQTLEREWRGETTTSGELRSLTKDVRSAERTVDAFQKLAREGKGGLVRAELPDALGGASETRTNLAEEIEGDLRKAGAGKAFPEEKTVDTFHALKSALPKDPELRGLADDARRTVVDEWRQQGWTRGTLGKVLDQYKDVTQAEHKLERAEKSKDPKIRADIPLLRQGLDRQRTEVRDEARRQIQSVSDKVPAADKEMVATARAMIMSEHGPQSKGYQSLIEQAHTAVVVTPRIEAVSKAYQKDGALAASAELERQTKTATPTTARRVVLGSMPTIDKITSDLGDSEDSRGPIEWNDGKGPSDTFLNLALSTDRASRSQGGSAAADAVAKSIVGHAENGVGFPYYGYAIQRSVREGAGASLPVAIARDLKAKGDTADAEYVVAYVGYGLSDLKQNAKSAVEDFQDATETIVRMRMDWGGVMSTEQANDATIKYVQRHKDILEDFNSSYDEIQGIGVNAQRATMSLDDEALATLDGLGNLDGLKDVRNDLFEDKYGRAVIGESEAARHEVQQTVYVREAARLADPNRRSELSQIQVLPSQGSGNLSLMNASRNLLKESAIQAYFSQKDSGSFVSKIGPLTKDSDFRSARGVELEPVRTKLPVVGLNGIGLALNTLSAKQTVERITSGDAVLGDYFKAFYYSMGATKDAGEFFGALAAYRGADGSARFLPALDMSTKVSLGRTLPKDLLTRVGQQPDWVKFATFVRATGTVIDASYAGYSFSKKDWAAGGLYTLGASGGGLMTASGLGFGSSWFFGAGAGPVGAGAVLIATTGLYFLKDSREKSKFEGPSREFLQDAGVDKDVAEKLADYDNNDGTSAGPALAATMRHFGVDRDGFVDKLNSLTPEQAEKMTHSAFTVNPDDDGDWPVTASNDYCVWGPEDEDPTLGFDDDGHYLYDPDDHTVRLDMTQKGADKRGDPNPRSMTALKDYVFALTGEHLIG